MDKSSSQNDQVLTKQEYLQFQGVVCHAFSPDGKYCAISLRNDHSIEIYYIKDLKDIETWIFVTRLSDQSQAISSVDWSINQQILSCSYDRSVIIWKPENKKWIKDLVISNNKRGVLTGKWSRNGKKFAIGTGDHLLFIGYYEPENKWWTSRSIGSFKSSVICVEFHPSGRFVAAGSTDYTIKIISCFVSNKVQSFELADPNTEDVNYNGEFKYATGFNDTILNVSNAGSWVTSIAFSNDGLKFAYATHGAAISHGKVTLDKDQQPIFTEFEQQLELPTLPLREIVFNKDDSKIIGGGYNRFPVIIEYIDEKTLKYKEMLKQSINAKQVQQTKKIDEIKNVFNKSKIQIEQTIINDPHASPISCVRLYQNQYVCTSDAMGSIQFWNI